MSIRTTLSGALFVASVSLLAVGCGGGKPVGDISGEISLNGNPVKAAQITAYNDKEEVVARVMALDGKYQMTGVPVGPVTLVVQTHMADGSPVTAPKAPLREGERPMPNVKKDDSSGLPTVLDPVPLKYMSAKQSGLQATITQGSMTKFDIAMTGKGEIPRGMPPPGSVQPGGFPPGVPPPPGGFPPGVPPPPGGFPPPKG